MDLDIDTPTTFNPKSIFKGWPRASLVKDEKLLPHPCGVYPQNIPTDSLTNLAAIPYDKAEEMGFLKIDFLHLSVYDKFKSREEIDKLINTEPDWSYLLLPSVQEKVFQLSKHGELLSSLKPSTIEELADTMALIRPGKKHLVGLYKKDKANTRKILYAKDETGYSFKKSHALAYAYVVVLQLHLYEVGKL